MHVCTIQSCPMPHFDGAQMQQGVHEINVTVNLKRARLSGDPRGYIQHEISRHLAGCVKHTKLPLGERIWTVSFTRAAMREFGFPARFVA